MNLTAPLDPASVLVTGTNTFTYDAASQVGSTGFSYDPRGRQTASPGHTFTWDGASRLKGIDPSTGSGQATLNYNGLGDLRTRAEGGTTIHYFYNYALGLTPIVAEQDEATGQFLRFYVWTPGGQLLYLIDAANGNNVFFYHFDRTGSTLALTDASGAVTDAYAYDPYGRLLAHQGTNPQPFTFVGKWGVRQEGPSGSLYHMRARYYDAGTQRFLSRDPIWPLTSDPLQINPYQYAANDPVSVVACRPCFHRTPPTTETWNRFAANDPVSVADVTGTQLWVYQASFEEMRRGIAPNALQPGYDLPLAPPGYVWITEYSGLGPISRIISVEQYNETSIVRRTTTPGYDVTIVQTPSQDLAQIAGQRETVNKPTVQQAANTRVRQPELGLFADFGGMSTFDIHLALQLQSRRETISVFDFSAP